MAVEKIGKKTYNEIITAAQELVLGNANVDNYDNKLRIRAILDGGTDGIHALLGNTLDTADADLLPTPNLLQSGIDRLAQKISGVPQVRVDVANQNDSDRALKRAEKIERIVQSYDEKQELSSQLAQAARWLPGYGFAVWIITVKTDRNGYQYPCAELRDPYETYVGNLGPDQQPTEVAILRSVPRSKLAQIYPEYASIILQKDKNENKNPSANPTILSTVNTKSDAAWESNNGEGVSIIEYYDIGGTYIIHPKSRTIFDFIPNILSTVPFVFMKRFSFNELKGQYDHVIGLMAMMAKINIMSAIAMEDAVFTETNISGELESGQYRKGRYAINYLSPGTQVTKPINNMPYQLFQQVDRLERQLRMVGGYPVTDDSQSPNSFVTGAGLSELNTSMSLMINEYREVIRTGLAKMDNKRLELDEIMSKDSKPMAGFINGSAFSENYKPSSDIAGNHRTRRIYGVMAGFDEPQKIVTGLQLVQAGVIDVETLQDNIDGLENVTKVQERIRKNKAEQVLFDSVLGRSAEGDPQATMAIIAIYEDPKSMTDILKKFYTPEDPEVSPEEMAMMQAAQQQQMPQGPPPSVLEALGGM